MLQGTREKIARHERLFSISVSFMLIAVLFVNSSMLGSFLVGIVALGFYLFLNGKMLGRAFFGEEDRLFRLVFGLFIFISLMALMGILVQIVTLHEYWYLFGMIPTTVITLLLVQFLGFKDSNKKSTEKKEPLFKRWYIFPVYGSYVVFIVLSFLLLYDARTGWIKGPIWNVIPPMFLQVYFIATVMLGAIVLLPGRVTLKLSCVVFHSIFSLSFLVIVLYPGILYYDPWYTLAKSQESTMSLFASRFHQSLSVRALNNLLKGRMTYALIATFAEVLCVDRYWATASLVPMLWGFLMPLTLYKLTRKIGGSEETSVLAAFLAIANLYFLAWGKLTEAASMGILFFLPFIYFLLRFLSSSESLSVRWIFSSRGIRTYLPLLIAFVSLMALHLLPTVLAVSFGLVALALKKYDAVHARFSSRLLLLSFFLLSVFLLPFAVVGRGILIPELGTAAFSVENVLDTSVWDLVFGISEEYAFKDALLRNIFTLLGLIGFAFALKRKEGFNKTFCFFLFLTFGVCLLDYRILQYAIVGKRIFGPGRVRIFGDIVALPFAGLIIMTSVKSLYATASRIRSRVNWRNLLAGTLVCVSFSAWATAAVYETYEYYTQGLLATSLEVEAVRFIDEHTSGRYVVLAPHATAVIGHGLMGYPNFEKMYYSIGRLGAPSEPSVAGMYDLMRATQGDVGYFMVVSFRGAKELNQTIDEASKIFGLFKIISDEMGQIYIMNYKIPPVPIGSNVTAFYWDAPSAYYVQNDLTRVIINPMTGTVDVTDFWGDLYERIYLEKTLVGGNPVGNITSVEYFDFQNGRWIDWDPETEIPPGGQFRFKVGFEEESLIGLLESGKPSVDLVWESGRASSLTLETGDFTRLYIPGLIGGEDSYDINSREYGFLYTTVHGENLVLQPAYRTDTSGTSLTFKEIEEYCGFALDNYMSYDLYVQNNADIDQWAFIEVWVPDIVYGGSFPPFHYSVDDGKTWVKPRFNVETGGPEPVRTLDGIDVNWIVSKPRIPWEVPETWFSYAKANGGSPELPGSYTDSGGAQNRIIFGVYLPATDGALLRLGSAVYYVRPLKVSYVFTDSENAYYGVRNMEEGVIKFYRLGASEYVGGLSLAGKPTSLSITQDESGTIESIVVGVPSGTVFSLLSAKDVDTRIDQNRDGIPDDI